MIKAAFGLPEHWQGVSWLPLYHDMGLIGDVMIAMYEGMSTSFLSPLDFLRKPVSWLRAISDSPSFVMSGAPNFGYELCVRRVTDEQMDGLDLSRWGIAYNGSEPIRPDTLDRLSEKFAAVGFRHTSQPCWIVCSMSCG